MHSCRDISSLETLEFSLVRKRTYGKESLTYVNIECGFDIETTSANPYGDKVGFMYAWALGFKDEEHIYYGRTWEEFVEFIDEIVEIFSLGEDRVLPIYVHNLGYEFQFMRNYFEWENVFAVDNRKVVKAVTTNGIEFRDSYILSNMRLEKVAENLVSHKIEKLVGQLDYKKVRHYGTPMTPDEMEYLKNDVLIILYYINEQIQQYQSVVNIPLTNTGRVRRYVRDNCFKDTNNKKGTKVKATRFRELISRLTITEDTYLACKRAIQGGFVHSNPKYTGEVISDAYGIDLSSAYSAVMVSERFPMSKAEDIEVNSVTELRELSDRYCLLFDIEFGNLRSKIDYDSYISSSKCWELENPVLNNGRVFSASKLGTTITEVDFKIIEQVYEWDWIGIANVKKFIKGYLPKPIIESILHLYTDKTQLKGVAGKEVEYSNSKSMLNSISGMMITDIVRENLYYEEEWGITPGQACTQLERYNMSEKRFLYYPWGIWVTAYNRKNLWSVILELKDDYLYSDTDGIKFINVEKHRDFIDLYNENITKKLETCLNRYELDLSLLSPVTVKGEVKRLGVWEYENEYKKFKTLGAKRYIVELKDGTIQTTIAGLPKKNGLDYITHNRTVDEVFDFFSDEMVIPADKSGKITHTYIDTPMSLLVTDYLGETVKVDVPSGIYLEECEFNMSVSENYNEFLLNLRKGYVKSGKRK